MKVVYYTSTHFLDAVFEQLKKIQQHVQLYLFIEVNPYSHVSTIVEIKNTSRPVISQVKNILSSEEYLRWEPYITAMKEVYFVNFSSYRSISLKSFVEGLELKNKIKNIKPDVIHFDTISTRAFALLPILSRYRIIISIHDAKPHFGENSWKEYLNNKLFYRYAHRFLFHSEYSKKEFIYAYPEFKKNCSVIPLLPYSVCSSFLDKDHKIYRKKYILFFGRLSAYKGVNLLLNVFEKLNNEYPDWQLYIAGKEVYGFTIDKKTLSKFGRKLKYFPEYLPAKKLMPLIQGASLIICPYLEASQSGVLMTSLALNKCVLATRVGAFPEYLTDGVDGFLCEPNEDAMINKIKEIIESNLVEKIEQNLKHKVYDVDHFHHTKKLLQIWSR